MSKNTNDDQETIKSLKKEAKQKKHKTLLKKANDRVKGLNKYARPALFVGFFALLGLFLLGFNKAENIYGDLPSSADQFVIRYDMPMVHEIPDEDFSAGDFPGMLLYGNGLMLCNPHAGEHKNNSNSVLNSLTYRNLSEKEISTMFNEIQDLGYDTVLNRDISPALKPSLFGTTSMVTLNTSNGSTTISLYQKENNTDYSEITDYIESECAKATNIYDPDDVMLESIKTSKKASSSTSQLDKKTIPVEENASEPTSKNVKGEDAKTLKSLIGKETKQFRSKDGKIVKVRVIPKIPDFVTPRPYVAKNDGKASAATDRSLRFLYVVAADNSTPSDASYLLNDLANTLPEYYRGQTGKTPTVAEVAIVRGSKTSAQYKVCPAAYVCDRNYPQNSASAFNLLDEYKKDGFNTIILYSWTSDNKCIGFGGPTDTSNINNVNWSKYGIAALSGFKCYKSGLGRVHRVAAHEAGHGFGLVHTCDTTLMDGCGYSGVDNYRPLRSDQAALLRNYSPYFNYTPPPCPSGTSGTYPNCITNTAPPPAAMFFPLYPARIMDTRSGHSTVDGQFAGIGVRSAGSTTALNVFNRAGVPSGSTSISVNVTIVNAQANGFATVYPCGSPLPIASSINYYAGAVTANSAISKVGTNGQICIYTLSSTDIVVDISGAFPSGSPYLAFNPARVMDTRAGQTTSDGQYAGTGMRGAGSSTAMTVVGRTGVPAGATAVTLKVSSVNPQGPGFLTVYPCGSPIPNASNVKYTAGVVASNTVISKVGTNGQVCIYTLTATDIIVDISGAFPSGSPYTSFNPARLIDTRPGMSTVDGQFAGIGIRGLGSTTALNVVGRGGVPSTAKAVSLNVTVVNPQSAGFVTVYPCGSPQPNTSNVNYSAARVLSFNSVLAKIGTNGQVCIFTSAGTDIIVDVNGAFTN